MHANQHLKQQICTCNWNARHENHIDFVIVRNKCNNEHWDYRLHSRVRVAFICPLKYLRANPPGHVHINKLWNWPLWFYETCSCYSNHCKPREKEESKWKYTIRLDSLQLDEKKISSGKKRNYSPSHGVITMFLDSKLIFPRGDVSQGMWLDCYEV